MTKAELIADLKSQDITQDDWFFVWLNKTHENEPLLTPFIRGYLSCKLSYVSNCLSERSEDYRDEILECLGYLIK